MKTTEHLNPDLLSIASRCIEAIKQDEIICLDDMWKGRGFVFFNGLAEACNRFDFKDDPSRLWDINCLAMSCQRHHKLAQYLDNLPGFVDGKPAPLVAFSQHFCLLDKFSQVILAEIDDQKHNI